MSPLLITLIVIGASFGLWLIRVYCFDGRMRPSLWWRSYIFDVPAPDGSWKNRYPRLRLWSRPLRVYVRYLRHRYSRRSVTFDPPAPIGSWKYRHPRLRRWTRPLRLFVRRHRPRHMHKAPERSNGYHYNRF